MVDVTGAVCVLFSESVSPESPPKWQADLRSRFGGVCVSPVHATLQTILPPQTSSVEGLAERIRNALSGVSATWTQGVRVEALYSSFYACWIAKLKVVANPELLRARAAIQVVTEQLKLRALIPPTADDGAAIITILQSVDPPGSKWDLSADAPLVDLSLPVMILLDAIQITQVIGPSEYTLLDSWDVH